MDTHRHELLAALTGRVVEVGAGDGANFGHYPPAVSGVLAIEPDPYLRRRAQRAAAEAPLPVTVVPGLAEQIPAASGGFHAAVLCLVLCSVTDPGAALRELRRVLRPSGQLRFYEHVRADTPALRRTQQILDATGWPFLAGGCHTGRGHSGTDRGRRLPHRPTDPAPLSGQSGHLADHAARPRPRHPPTP